MGQPSRLCTRPRWLHAHARAPKEIVDCLLPTSGLSTATPPPHKQTREGGTRNGAEGEFVSVTVCLGLWPSPCVRRRECCAPAPLCFWYLCNLDPCLLPLLLPCRACGYCFLVMRAPRSAGVCVMRAWSFCTRLYRI